MDNALKRKPFAGGLIIELLFSSSLGVDRHKLVTTEM